MKSSVWLGLLFAAMMLTFDAHALSEPNPLKGKRLYRSYCMVCHGADGKGAGPLVKKLNLKPADLSLGKYQAKRASELAAIVGGHGRNKDSKMPSWGSVMPTSDLRDVAAYVAVLPRKDLNYIGDTRRGRAIYKSACIACHGQYGAGNGVLAYLIDIPMVDQTNSNRMQQISDEKLIATIQEGEGHFMASWQGTLSDSEIADVASYVRLLPKLASQKSVEIAADPFEGRRLYRSYCLVCHGIEGNSTGPLADTLNLEPADLSAAKYQRKKASELAVIIAGYRRTEESQMPRWGTVFPMTDLQNIAAYITLLTKDDLSLKGDRRRGRAVFKGACVACHGKFGRGKGILAQLINIPMIDFTDSKKMAQISDEELLNAIKEGKGAFMASWKDAFNDAEIIDVASYVRSLAR